MTIAVIVQARMGSTRLPGKVLQPIAGKPMLARVVERASASREADLVAVATTDLAMDDAVASWAEEANVPCFRGSEEDVLARYLGAARMVNARTVARVTADCPLLDPLLLDACLRAHADAKADVDYTSNVLERTYPRGLDVEVVSLPVLERLDREAVPGPEREHVTLRIHLHPEDFRVQSLRGPVDRSSHRWTVDSPQDMVFVRSVYERLGSADGPTAAGAVLRLLEDNPDLAALNTNVRQRATIAPVAPARWKGWRSLTLAI